MPSLASFRVRLPLAALAMILGIAAACRAEAYAALGREEEALRALQPVRPLSPPQYEEVLSYLDLTGTGGGEVRQ